MLTVGSLFAGIGGIDLGLERTGGFRTAWFSEIDPFANAVLRKHWPDVPNFGDVRNVGAGTPRVDLIAGGFPCQPVSLAGKRLAQDDPRWLWPQVARVVGDLRPRVVLLENVPGLRSKGLGDVLQDLSALGYDAEWDGIPAAAVGAPHQRDRVWIVAYPHDSGRTQQLRAEPKATADATFELRGDERSASFSDPSANPDSDRKRSRRSGVPEGEGQAVPDLDGLRPRVFRGALRPSREWAAESAVGRVADGVSGRVAQLSALGNAVVPQVSEAVGHMILDAVAAGRI